jgi:hypothetical protein
MIMRSLLLLFASLALVGCDLDAQPLLQNYDGETVQGADVVDLDVGEDPPEMDGDTFSGFLGPSDIGQGDHSGSTATFTGTGGRVCLIIDPQSVWRDDKWIDESGSEQNNPFMYDYPYDDGDLDLQAGLAAYYTGSPGERMGDFINSFPDDNGVDRRVDLNTCLLEDRWGIVGSAAGRGTPEWCSFETVADTQYRIAITVFSVPTNDNSLKYAFEIRDGDCPVQVDECTLRGDYDEHENTELPSNFDNVEDMYCRGPADGPDR